MLSTGGYFLLKGWMNMIRNELHCGKILCFDTVPSFEEHYDLAVIGLGTAGAISLVTAGRKGLKVLGVEQHYAMGGTGTVGGTCGYYYGAFGGLYTEIDDQTLSDEYSLFVDSSWRDSKALILEREALKSNATIMYRTKVTGVYLSGNQVMGLQLLQDGRFKDISASVFIDATGEAFVCHMAGGECFHGREYDRQTQPCTVTSTVINPLGHTHGTNYDAGFVNQHDPYDVSRVLIKANTHPMYLKDDYSKESTKYLNITPHMGIREGRKIRGKKVLTLREITERSWCCEKPLFYTYANADNHGKDMAFENEEMCDWTVACGLWGMLFSVGIPLEALIPHDLENIMVAGRCLSVDHNLACGVRMQRDMEKCGEAAAYVCAEALRSGKQLQDTDYANILPDLLKTGCLNPENNLGFVERQSDTSKETSIRIPETPQEIMEYLSGDKPGWGIWNARLIASHDPYMITLLKEALTDGDDNLKKNAALALGLLKDPAALPLLREMAFSSDNHVPSSSLKYVYTRGVSAIYLLGKLKDTRSLEALTDVVRKRGIQDLTGFTFSEFYFEPNDVYAQYVLFAARAIADIVSDDPMAATAALTPLLRLLEAEDYHIMITLKTNSESLHDLKPKLIDFIRYRLKGTR